MKLDTAIDLNADLGEGDWASGADSALLTMVTSANVACGFHAGDARTMAAVVAAAAARGVAVGAQVSYADREGFGRRELEVSAADLAADVGYQLGALQALAQAAGTKVSYVKPHGALYHRITHDPVQALAVVTAISPYGLPLLTLPGAVVAGVARDHNLPVRVEAFADRGYTADGALVPRSQPGALVTDPEAVVTRVLRLVSEGIVEAVSGELVAVTPDSICLHSDTPGAVALARRVREALAAAGVRLQPFGQ